jgi:uncharacterized membrane protein
MQSQPQSLAQNPTSNAPSSGRKFLSAITVILLIFNLIIIFVTDIETHHRGFWLSMIYDILPLLLTLFTAFMKKESLVTLAISAAVSTFFILVYII